MLIAFILSYEIVTYECDLKLYIPSSDESNEQTNSQQKKKLNK